MKQTTKVAWNVADWDEDILERFRIMAFEALRRNGLPVDWDVDWRQEMCLAVAARLTEHDPALASRRTFMKRAAQWRLQELLRERLRRPLGNIRRPLDSTCFGEATDADGDPYGQAIVESGAFDPTPDIERRLDLEMVADRLPTDLREVYTLLEIHTPKETAEQLGRSLNYVYERIRLIRKQFEALFNRPAWVRETA